MVKYVQFMNIIISSAGVAISLLRVVAGVVDLRHSEDYQPNGVTQVIIHPNYEKK